MAFKNRKSNYPLYETTHFKDLREMTENVADKYPDKVAFRYKKHPRDKETSTYTYEESRVYVRSIATEFISLGLTEQKVALIGEAAPEWAFSYFALMSVGAIVVPIDKELPAEDTASIMNTAECSAIVFSTVTEEKVKGLRESVPTLKNFVEWGESAADFALSISAV